jgi:hypothetical protein
LEPTPSFSIGPLLLKVRYSVWFSHAGWFDGVFVLETGGCRAYDHENEGEMEIEFQEYRKSLKVALKLVAKVDDSMVMHAAMACVRTNLQPAGLAGW